MADYLKLFQTSSDYAQWENSSEYLTPNVCKIVENNSIVYNPLVDNDPYNGHEYVDLGLPSGTKWAKYNVGANSETDAGLFFAWGETQGYTEEQIDNEEHDFYEETYKFYSDGSYTKYNDEDGKTVLDLEDDAAHVNMGGDWRMFTKEDFEELLEYTTIEENDETYVFTSIINGNKLILPKVRVIGVLGGSNCTIWSSSLDNDNFWGNSSAYALITDNSVVSSHYRYYGIVARGVVG